MRRIAAVLIGLCFTGCGGSVVLESRTDHVPPPMRTPPPAAECRTQDVDRHEAVQLAVTAAAEHRITHASVEKVERSKHSWKVVLWGQDAHGWPVEVRAKVDCRTGKVVDYRSEVERRSKHHDKHHGKHDAHDHDHDD